MTTIKKARQKLDLTQKQIADLLGTTQHRVSEIERGVSGRSETRQMRHHLAALLVIGEDGLIEKLASKIEEI